MSGWCGRGGARGPGPLGRDRKSLEGGGGAAPPLPGRGLPASPSSPPPTPTPGPFPSAPSRPPQSPDAPNPALSSRRRLGRRTGLQLRFGDSEAQAQAGLWLGRGGGGRATRTQDAPPPSIPRFPRPQPQDRGRTGAQGPAHLAACAARLLCAVGAMAERGTERGTLPRARDLAPCALCPAHRAARPGGWVPPPARILLKS